MKVDMILDKTLAEVSRKDDGTLEMLFRGKLEEIRVRFVIVEKYCEGNNQIELRAVRKEIVQKVEEVVEHIDIV